MSRRAPDHLDHPPARDRPGFPAAQEPGPRSTSPSLASAPRTCSTRRPATTGARPPAGGRRPGRPGPGPARTRAPRGSRLASYVNDRPYVASSFLSRRARPDVRHRAERAAARNGRSWPTSRCRWRRGCRSCRAAAGRTCPPPVRAARLRGRGARRSRWTRSSPTGATAGTSRCSLTGHAAGCASLLEHLFVLLPVLDDDKHYWVGARRGRQAAAAGRRSGSRAHPDHDLIARRYLRHDQPPDPGRAGRAVRGRGRLTRTERRRRTTRAEEAVERQVGLHAQRLAPRCSA